MEKVLADKANWFTTHGHDVVIITTDQRGRKPAFPMSPSIRQTDLGIGYEDNNGGSFLNKVILFPIKQLRHRKKLSQLLKEEKADIVVSMFCNEVSFLHKIKDGSAKVLEVHFSRFKRLQYGRKGLWAIADRFMSRQDLRYAQKYDRFVVLTEEDREYWGNLPNMVVIPNGTPKKEKSPLDSHTAIAVGRYSYQKGLDRLVKAWGKAETGDWKLKLVGDGETRASLEELIYQLNLGESVELSGIRKDMNEVYRNASLLLLSSRYEGLPVVLLEAQAHGIPIISFDCKCGPKDVIRNGVDGILVREGDIDGFADALSLLLADQKKLREMGDAAYEGADRWDPETIMERWLNLFESILSSRR